MNHAHEKAWVATPILLRFGAPENGISTPRAGFTPVTMTQRYVTSIFLDDSQTPPNPGFLLYELLVHVPYRYWILSLIRTGAGYHVPNGLFIFRKTRVEKNKNKNKKKCTSVHRYLRETVGIGKGGNEMWGRIPTIWGHIRRYSP